MPSDLPESDQSAQLLLLELALTVGRMQNMDLITRCQEFLRVLLVRKNMSYGAIWLHPRTPDADPGAYQLTAAFPEAGVDARAIEADHPVAERIRQSTYFVSRYGDPDFADLVLEKGVGDGAIATLRLGDLGLLRLYWDGGEPFTLREANQLLSILEIFAISLDGAIASAELKRQLAAREQLVAEKEEAILASETKSNFLAKMSHELRTPLNAILGFSEVIAKEIFGPPGSAKYAEYAQHIHNSAGLLLSLVDDLLDITTIENEELELNKTSIFVAELMNECANLIAPQIDAKEIDLDLAPPDETLTLFADRKHLTQVLVNLLTNAAKFTNPGGRIEFGAAATDSRCAFTISDNGIGIPPDKLRGITAPFVQIRNDAYHAEKGWGLGLSIAKSLVELHEGHMDITSTPGEGTSVRVEVPLVQRTGPSPDPARSKAAAQ